MKTGRAVIPRRTGVATDSSRHAGRSRAGRSPSTRGRAKARPPRESRVVLVLSEAVLAIVVVIVIENRHRYGDYDYEYEHEHEAR